MTCDELKAAINDEIAQNARIAAIRSRIDAGEADFLDSELYTAITAEITAEQMRRNVLTLSDREPAFVGAARERYTDTFNVFNAVQRILDAVTGIRIRTVQPEFENDRAHKIGHSLNDPTVPESVIERRAYSATENFVRSQHDRCTKANASFRSRAGLDCRITRTGGAKCCDWCASVSGSFTTSSAPDGIWGRHDNCKCSITYETRRGSFQQLSGTGKGWGTVEELPDIPLRTVSAAEYAQIAQRAEVHFLSGDQIGTGAGERAVLTEEQAKALQDKHGLTNPAESGILKLTKISNSGSVLDPMNRELYNRMKSNLERRGCPVIAALHGSDDEKFLLMFGAEAIADENGIMHLGEVPSASAFFEEIIHYTQIQKYGSMQSTDFIERDAREIAANRKLLKHGNNYGFSENDFSEIRNNLMQWEESFKRRVGVSYDESDIKREI